MMSLAGFLSFVIMMLREITTVSISFLEISQLPRRYNLHSKSTDK